MACPSALSGKYGRVLVGSCNVTELTEWTLEYGAEPQVFYTASTGGAQSAVPGAEGGTGSFSFLKTANDTADFATGDCVLLELRHNVAGTQKASGYALLGRFRYGAQLRGEVQTVTVDFTTVDEWTFA